MLNKCLHEQEYVTLNLSLQNKFLHDIRNFSTWHKILLKKSLKHKWYREKKDGDGVGEPHLPDLSIKWKSN